MTDRPIIFSAPMVQAIRANLKFQTRRLASSPLRLTAAGDRLWVRENFREPAMMGDEPWYMADGEPEDSEFLPGRPSIHMPRRLSRNTLLATDARRQHLQDMTDDDAEAEGVVWCDERQAWHVPGVPHPCKAFPYLARATPREMFAALWDVLHGSGAWLGNPQVTAITFTVEHVNIDALETMKASINA